MNGLRGAAAVLRNDLALARAEPLATILAVVLPLNFLVLFMLFALSGGRVPAALYVPRPAAPGSAQMVTALRDALTFDLRPVPTRAAATDQLGRGEAVVAITVPPDLAPGGDGPAVLAFTLDNENADFADDVRRALPLALLSFTAQQPGGLPVGWREVDTYRSDVGFLAYIAVSLLTVSILVGGLLTGGRSVAGEWERGTIKELLLAPVPPWAVVAGKLGAGVVQGLVSAALVLGAVIAAGAHPASWSDLGSVAAVTVLALVAFLSLGLAAGSLMRRVNSVTPLAFAVGLPLFFISGPFGPLGWSGAAASVVARVFPVAYANAALQHAFHGYWTLHGGAALVWPVLAAWTAAALAASAWSYGRAAAPH